MLVLVVLAAGLGAWRLDRWIATTDIPPLVVETGVEVLDRDGRLLRAYTVEDGRWRLPVSYDAVDPGFVEMLIAYEDRRFWRHPGIDLRAFGRAAWQGITSGRIVSGGSTLTMQVARLLENSGTGAWQGKLRQIRLALALERILSKREILTLYLHLAPYGGNIEGIRAASLTWFGTEPARLTAAQSALLVALPQAPSSRRPDRYPEAAQRARDRVLDRAVRFTALTESQIAWARAEPIPTERRAFPALAAHLADRALAERPTQGTHHLTLDADLQRRMEDLAARAVEGHGPRMSAAIMVMDHLSGALLASVGSPDYTDVTRAGFVDMTSAVRSPGSALKPLIYGLAFDAGLLHPESLIGDRPTRFGNYAPRNFDNLFRGEVTAAEALQMSLNIPAVSLLRELGPAQMLSAMRRAGMEIDLPVGEEPGLAIALGGIGTRMEDLMRLYAAVARGGVAAPWHWRQGDAAPEGQRVIGPTAAWYLSDILGDVPPPASAPRSGLAYKTGTSYGHRDAWAFGFDGRHVVGIWMGRADGASVPGAFGADLSAPVLFEAFARIGPTMTRRPAPPAGALIVSRSQLPAPLQRFSPRQGPLPASDGPDITFPPEGAVLARQPDLPIVARVAEGRPPFTWLWNGAPLATGRHDREVTLEDPGIGFGELTVIDAEGRAQRRALEIAAP
ncbi:Multimodular transpeptidase-transglycosylase [Roseibacterium elongatum DSM 19469]|uniref:peptidoglycan glycosyltransferase n=2 Tax=Roseicyclus elongatus TaxID=159346 RepID=W8RQP2_9RHOB|nr:penicillin-binding protein 1C [Roseibacterium elongatum]AHM03393.1 Multimodular transpeptidase-transglycosylase [Roseibacterium elongatum DSM 19469]